MAMAPAAAMASGSCSSSYSGHFGLRTPNITDYTPQKVSPSQNPPPSTSSTSHQPKTSPRPQTTTNPYLLPPVNRPPPPMFPPRHLPLRRRAHRLQKPHRQHRLKQPIPIRPETRSKRGPGRRWLVAVRRRQTLARRQHNILCLPQRHFLQPVQQKRRPAMPRGLFHHFTL